jgi:hypothetical protein
MSYLRVGHGVERSDCQWILVHEEEVSGILFFHNVSKTLLISGAQIIIIILRNESRNSKNKVYLVRS